MSLDYRLQRWEHEHDLLDKDFDSLTEWWIKNKHCDCDIQEEYGMFCEHYDTIVTATLGKKIDELYDRRLKISMEAFNEVFKN